VTPPQRPPRARRDEWLARDLSLRLMGPLLVIVVATGALGAWGAQRLTDIVFDHWLLDGAHGLALLVRFDQGRATVNLSPDTEKVLLYDDLDRTWFSVAQAGRALAGNGTLPERGERTRHYPRGEAFDAQLGGTPVRVARVEVADGHGGTALVLVAETLQKRSRAHRELLAMLWPLVLLVLVTVGAIVFAVRRTARPLEALAARWNRHSHESLDPVPPQALPRELRPFATALNDLLARIRAMLAHERQFAATVAHQVRTPLAGLELGLARAAEAQDLPSVRRVLAELAQSTQRAARLTQQLLSLGRLDAKLRDHLELQPVDLVALAQDVGALHADQALAKGIELELAAPPGPVRVQAQPDLIAEAVSNLLDNAMRHTPPGGRVLIEFEPAPPTLCISDSGPGIPEDERERVFERFVRGAASADGEGSGLGLAIVRDIAALHRSTVTLADSAWGGVRVVWVFRGEPG
jgi:two-component system sensor histidine kinase TctE